MTFHNCGSISRLCIGDPIGTALLSNTAFSERNGHRLLSLNIRFETDGDLEKDALFTKSFQLGWYQNWTHSELKSNSFGKKRLVINAAMTRKTVIVGTSIARRRNFTRREYQNPSQLDRFSFCAWRAYRSDKNGEISKVAKRSFRQNPRPIQMRSEYTRMLSVSERRSEHKTSV